MEDKAIRGVPWTMLSYAGNKAITFGVTIVLARLLVPGDFGLIALGMLVLGVPNLFGDFGLTGTLVLRQDLDSRAKGTALTMMVASGLGLTLVVALLAPLAADLFHEPRLSGVILALAPTVLFSSLAWFYDALLQRELEFRRRFAGQVVQAATYAAVAILLAILGAGVWSLVVGQLAGVASYAAAFVSLAPYRVRPTWDRRAARDVLATSRGFLLLTGVAFLSQNVDYFAIGRALSATQMGFYSLAYRLGELPYWGIADPVAQATFPGFARMLQRGEDVRPSFLSVLGLVAFISCPLGVLLSGAAEPFTRAVFGDQWLPMVGPLAVLGIWAAIRPVQVTVAWLLNSVGHAGLMGAIDLALLVPLVPGALIAAHRGSITAVAYVMLAYMAISLVILALVARRQADVSLSSQWAAVRAVVVACPFAWGAARGASEILASAPPGTSLVAAVVAGTVGYAGIISLVEPGRLMQAAAQISRVIGRAPAPA